MEYQNVGTHFKCLRRHPIPVVEKDGAVELAVKVRNSAWRQAEKALAWNLQAKLKPDRSSYNSSSIMAMVFPLNI